MERPDRRGLYDGRTVPPLPCRREAGFSADRTIENVCAAAAAIPCHGSMRAVLPQCGNTHPPLRPGAASDHAESDAALNRWSDGRIDPPRHSAGSGRSALAGEGGQVGLLVSGEIDVDVVAVRIVEVDLPDVPVRQQTDLVG